MTNQKNAAIGEQDLRVTEGVSGLWHYHFSKPGEYVGLCGTSVMNSGLKLADWKVAENPSHMPKRATYCRTCDAARNRISQGEVAAATDSTGKRA
jgi:hypothetical protein